MPRREAPSDVGLLDYRNVAKDFRSKGAPSGWRGLRSLHSDAAIVCAYSPQNVTSGSLNPLPSRPPPNWTRRAQEAPGQVETDIMEVSVENSTAQFQKSVVALGSQPSCRG